MNSVDLETAQQLILQNCHPLSLERLGLSEVVGRVAARDYQALEPLPGYDGSMRDGYAVAAASPGDPGLFVVIDEVAAGDIRSLFLQCGEAVRIMTGGLIPDGCGAVIPQEDCICHGKSLRVGTAAATKTFIHRRGTEIRRGQTILEKGSVLSSEQQVLLAGTGYDSVDIARRPVVSFFCTGSELLTDIGAERQPGKRLSANQYLLAGLIAKNGAVLQEQEIVEDDMDLVVSLMTAMAGNGSDIIISTGGMGPGKYDLVEGAFKRCGGEVVYNSINMRPGKATLFGKLGDALFFGLPGPPAAVKLLFSELVVPAIWALQGVKNPVPVKIEAVLASDISLPGRGLLRLKSGKLTLDGGRCLVRVAARGENSNCYIFCPPAIEVIKKGEKVMLHMCGSQVFPAQSC